MYFHSVLPRTWWFVLASGFTQSCPTLHDPMVYAVHGILQARILEWVAFPFSRGFPNPGIKPRSPALQAVSLYQLSHKESPRILEWVAFPFSRGFPNPGIKPRSPTLQADSLPAEPHGKPFPIIKRYYSECEEASHRIEVICKNKRVSDERLISYI